MIKNTISINLYDPTGELVVFDGSEFEANRLIEALQKGTGTILVYEWIDYKDASDNKKVRLIIYDYKVADSRFSELQELLKGILHPKNRTIRIFFNSEANDTGG